MPPSHIQPPLLAPSPVLRRSLDVGSPSSNIHRGLKNAGPLSLVKTITAFGVTDGGPSVAKET